MQIQNLIASIYPISSHLIFQQVECLVVDWREPIFQLPLIDGRDIFCAENFVELRSDCVLFVEDFSWRSHRLYVAAGTVV